MSREWNFIGFCFFKCHVTDRVKQLTRFLHDWLGVSIRFSNRCIMWFGYNESVRLCFSADFNFSFRLLFVRKIVLCWLFYSQIFFIRKIYEFVSRLMQMNNYYHSSYSAKPHYILLVYFFYTSRLNENEIWNSITFSLYAKGFYYSFLLLKMRI